MYIRRFVYVLLQICSTSFSSQSLCPSLPSVSHICVFCRLLRFLFQFRWFFFAVLPFLTFFTSRLISFYFIVLYVSGNEGNTSRNCYFSFVRCVPYFVREHTLTHRLCLVFSFFHFYLVYVALLFSILPNFTSNFSTIRQCIFVSIICIDHIVKDSTFILLLSSV